MGLYVTIIVTFLATGKMTHPSQDKTFNLELVLRY